MGDSSLGSVGRFVVVAFYMTGALLVWVGRTNQMLRVICRGARYRHRHHNVLHHGRHQYRVHLHQKKLQSQSPKWTLCKYATSKLTFEIKSGIFHGHGHGHGHVIIEYGAWRLGAGCWITREIREASSPTMRGHFGCIFKGTEEYTTGVWWAFYVR